MASVGTERGSQASVFVGRDRELRELAQGLDDAAAGNGRLFLLVGEPGIGKSRLADELTRVARERGHRILWGRAWEAAGAPPYWPWVQVIRTYIRNAEPAIVHRQLGSGAALVARMVPDLRSHLPELPPPPDAESDSARFQMFDSAATFLGAVARETPLLLVLDDLHAADEPSLLFLRFLASQMLEMRVMVVGTYRDVELRDNHPLADAIAQLTREPATRLLTIAGLRPPEMRELLRGSAGRSVGRHQLTGLWRTTGGNPLYLGEAVRLLASEGRLEEMTAAGPPRLAMPAGIREVITRRVRGLDEPSVRALARAAAIGPEFALDVLQHIADLDLDPLYALVENARRAGLVLPIAGSVGRFRFSHQLIREVLYDELSLAERLQLHRRIAATLEEIFAGALDSHLAELAHHYFEASSGASIEGEAIDDRSNTAERAYRYARRAGDQAAASLAYEEAVRLYRMALDVAVVDPAQLDAEARSDLLLALGDAQARSGDLPGARPTFLEVADIARRAVMPTRLARATLGYGGRFLWARAGDDPHLVGLLQDALVLLGGGDDRLRVRLLARLSCAWRDSPAHREQCDALSRQAIDLARQLADPQALSYALTGRYGAVYWPENPEERLQIAEELLGTAEAAQDPERLIDAHMILAFTYSDFGRTRDAHAALDNLTALAEELRQPAQLWLARALRASLSLMEGDYAAADAAMEREIEEDYPTTPIRDDVSHAQMHRFLLARERGQLAEEEETVRSSVASFPWYPLHRVALTLLLIDLGRMEEARTVLDELAEDEFRAIYRDNMWLLGMSLVSEAVAVFGDRRLAAVLYDQLGPFAGRHAVGQAEGSVGVVDRYLGLLAQTMGRLEEAERHLTRAIALNERMAARPWAAHARRDLAVVLRQRDGVAERARAAELERQALETARAIGMNALAQRLGEAADGDPARTSPAEGVGQFRLEGDYWTVSLGAQPVRIRDAKGMGYLAHLLGEAGREIHALDLIQKPGAAHQLPAPELGLRSGRLLELGPALDAKAKAAYRARISELEGEIDAAQLDNDLERANRARAEVEFITGQLAAAFGLGGRDRPAGTAAERARISVTRAIRLALSRIEEQAPDVGRHLVATIRTGTYCAYVPDPRAPVRWKF